MKKLYYLGAITGLILTSCANDDLIDNQATNSVPNDGAIAFNMRLNNQTRDNVALNTVMDNFGVFAFKVKGDDDAAANAAMNALDPFPAGGTMSENVVMNNYKVEYDPSQKRYGSYWNYDGVNGQYLKYWDGSYRNTYFFAYGPHTTTAPTFVKGAAHPSIKFGTVEQTTDEQNAFVYADVTKCLNEEYVTKSATVTTETPKTVPLTFHRGMSKVRIAFHENIPGYTVEMAELTFDGKAGTHGVVGIPADYTGGTWSRGEYAWMGDPVVSYDDDFNASLNYINLVKDDAANLEFELPTGEIGGAEHSAKTPSPTVYNVIPNDNNSGLQFVMNYTLKSEDTNETIEVKGARVYVKPEYTQWAQNTVYTYVFLITRNSSGTTTGTDPNPDPEDPQDALYPIIFDQVVVTDLDNANESEWIVNGLQLSASEVNVAAGASATITCTLNNLAITECPGIHVVWSTRDESVATVANGVITGVAEGTTTITCTAYENYVSDTEHSNMFTKTCTVNVTAAP